MRESELVNKIIKEWEGLTPQEKKDLFKSYTSEKHISEDKSESSEKGPSPDSSKSKKKQQQASSSREGINYSGSTPSKAKAASSPAKKAPVQLYIRSSSSKKEKEQSESSDFAREGVKKDFEISESSSKEIGKKVGAKRKRITKDVQAPKTEYLKFFKFYYDKLSGEHTRWSSSQITTIIKLLWKKKLVTDKAASKASLRAPREKRKISGRMAFRRSFSYSGIEAYERWKQLTHESREYWKVKGEGLRSGERRAIKQTVQPGRIRKNSEESLQNSSGKKLYKLLHNIVA
mgnify:CR=1 FL=1|jgi:hypothetical protein